MSKQNTQEKVAVVLTKVEVSTVRGIASGEVKAALEKATRQQAMAKIELGLMTRYPDSSKVERSAAIYAAAGYKVKSPEYNALKSLLNYVRTNGVKKLAAGKKPTSKKVKNTPARVYAELLAAARVLVAKAEKRATEKFSARRLANAALAKAFAA